MIALWNKIKSAIPKATVFEQNWP